MMYRDNNGEFQELYTAPVGDTLPVGSTIPFSGTKIPTNWLEADGSLVSRETYKELFDAIGTTYGEGDGSTTFALPNLKQRVPVGIDSTDEDFDTIGKTGGEKEHTLTVEEMPAHSHFLNNNGNSELKITINANSGGNNYNMGYQGSDKSELGPFVIAEETGGSQPHNNMPPYITLKYIIKAKNALGVVGVVQNEKNTSKNDGYSCDYLNTQLENLDNKETYSTEEQVIGKWIDGKTLYRKTLQIPSLKTPFSTGMDNIDILIFDLANSYLYWNEELLYSADPTKFTYNRTQHTIYSRDSEITSSNWSALITIRYTKTTE